MTSDYLVVQLSHADNCTKLPYASGCVMRMQCGSVQGRIPGFDLYDDFPDGISDANQCFSEATGIYAATRSGSLPERPYYGFAQYRRYLDFRPSDLSEDRILCSSFRIGVPLLDQYRACHPLTAYAEFMARLAMADRMTFDRVKEYFETSHEFYRANCFVMPSSIFAEYSDFVGRVIPIMVDATSVCDMLYANESPYQKRYMSFLFERLTSFWISDRTIRTGCEVADRPIVDVDIPNKENGTR